MRRETREKVSSASLGPLPPDAKLDKLYDAIREVRAGKTPSSWTPAERQLFAMLPEASSET